MDATRPISADISDTTAAVRRDGDLRAPDLMGMARRHWWLLALFVILAVVGAWKFTGIQQKVYQSSTSVLVQPTGSGQDTNVVGGRTKGDINLDTEAQLVQSTQVAKTAADLLRSGAAPDTLAANVAVEVPANTSVLVISYTAGTAQAAQAGSHAFAEAYLSNRENADKARLAERTAALDAKVKQLNGVLAQLNARIVTLKQDNPDRANLESQRQTTVSQLNTLNAQFNEVSTTAANAGTIIRDAELPTSPIKPNKLLNLASGAMVGLLLGIGAAFVRERLDKRVRRSSDLPRRADVAVLASVPGRVPPPLDETFPPFGTGGRIFNRLRNEILASIPPPPPVSHTRSLLHGQMVVVAGASRGAASTVVAANLAAAFARTGAETVLVCARLPESLVDPAPVTKLFGVRAIPGLSDVLARRTSLAAATQRVPRHPYLRVLTTGGTASAGGLLQSQMLRDTLNAVRGRAAYVVIEAPSTATSADAQSLASLADAAILAVELRRTTYAEVVDATDQLRRVGTPLLGAVVLPKLATVSGGDAKAAGAGAGAATGTDDMDLAELDADFADADLDEPGLDDERDGDLEEHAADGLVPPVRQRPGRRREFLPSGVGEGSAETMLTARVARSNGAPGGLDSSTVILKRVDETNLHRTIAELTEAAPAGGATGSSRSTPDGITMPADTSGATHEDDDESGGR
jgi:capsular polysaccharide biosynthesis protein/Mrp family chromosome partitioning ATPase